MSISGPEAAPGTLASAPSIAPPLTVPAGSGAAAAAASGRLRISRRFVAAAAGLLALTTLAKAVGALKEVVIASEFGASPSLDLYFLLLTIASFFITAIGQALHVTLQPTLLRVDAERVPGRTASFVTEVLAAAAIVTTLCYIALVAIVVVAANYDLPGLQRSSADRLLTALLLYGPAVLMSTVSMAAGGALNAFHRPFLAPAAAISGACALLVGIVAAGKRFGVSGVIAAHIVGAAAEIVLIMIFLRRTGLLGVPRWAGSGAHLRSLWTQFWPTALSCVLAAGTLLVDQAMAGMLGPGNIAVLGYSMKLSYLVLMLGHAVLHSLIFPQLSRKAAIDDFAGLRTATVRAIGLTFALTAPLVLALCVGSRELTALIFQRGAFGPEESAAVSAVQVFQFLQIPVALAAFLLMRLLTAIQRARALLLVSALGMVANVLLNLALMPSMGLRGIALATTLVQVLVLATLATLARRSLPRS